MRLAPALLVSVALHAAVLAPHVAAGVRGPRGPGPVLRASHRVPLALPEGHPGSTASWESDRHLSLLDAEDRTAPETPFDALADDDPERPDAAVVGIGSSAAGCFGGRGGGHRNLRAGGGGMLGAGADGSGSESYDYLGDDELHLTRREPVSTFSSDVDTASYSNVRRFLLRQGRLPPAGAVRIEELVNYFPYEYESPWGGAPFVVHTETAGCPWNPERRLLRVALQVVGPDQLARVPSNLVFLVDVSGSMQSDDKLPLLVECLELLVDQLEADDRVAIVTYAGESRIALPPTPGDRKDEIRAALRTLRSGGSTHASAGVRDAYAAARQSFVAGGTNVVLLCTDGDFNVGVTGADELVELIRAEAGRGIFLSVLGFGTGNLKDARMERVADDGNGVYAYVDRLAEGRKLLAGALRGSLRPVAKDLKLQVVFHPGTVEAYRLVGYENRRLTQEEFEDDLRDAGDVGAGHQVTAFYEIVPALAPGLDPTDGGSDWRSHVATGAEVRAGELGLLRIRWKAPEGTRSELFETPLADDGAAFLDASPDFRFAASVAAFGMALRDSPHRGELTCADVERLARDALGADASGHRVEFLRLVATARVLGR